MKGLGRTDGIKLNIGYIEKHSMKPNCIVLKVVHRRA